MTVKNLLKGKTIVVTGSASGIGYETARLLTVQGATVLGVDLTKNFDHVEEFYRADLSDKRTIEALVDVLPDKIDGIANIAGLPPTAPAEKVLAVNLVGLKLFTELMIPKLNDRASIVNLASLAGFGWAQSVEAIKAIRIGEAEANKARIEAENMHSDAMVAMELEKARLEAMPKIVSEMVKPAEKINSININHLSGGGYGRSSSKDGDKPVVNQALDSIMEMAVQLPVLKKIGDSIGMNFDDSMSGTRDDKKDNK